MIPNNKFDVLIAGAGAAGLMAAHLLSEQGLSIAVIEARKRTGGRIHTIDDKNFSLPVETGAEFIHGKLELTLDLLKKANINYTKVKGDIWQKTNGLLEEQKDFIEDYEILDKKFKSLTRDISVAEFLKNHLQHNSYEDLSFSLKNYVEGYYAADTEKASTLALYNELSNADEEQYRIEGGYILLTNYLEDQCRAQGVQFFLSEPIHNITWKQNAATFECDNNIYSGKKAVITLPVGVLRNGDLFKPELPEKLQAAQQLGFGPVVKTIFEFDERFWGDRSLTYGNDMGKLGFLFSQEKIPTWWTQYPDDAAIITGWSGGPHAEELKGMDAEAIMKAGLRSLSGIFDIDVKTLKARLKGWHVYNWADDPYSLGAYSYDVVGGKALQDVLKAPVKNTVFFAGEGLYDGIEIGTVEGALKSATAAVDQMSV